MSESRHARQVLLPAVGEAGQARIRAARVVVVGCGALGSVVSEILVRAGVGFLTIVDRDVVELSNLQRQSLFTEKDAAEGREKAIAAAEALRAIDSGVDVRPLVKDLVAENALRLLGAHDLVVDATDNFAARLLINDAAFSLGVPWIYGAAIADEGALGVFRPGETPCLRCFLEVLPPPGSTPTCDTAGVLGPVTHLVASLEASEALRLLATGTAMTGIARVSLWSEDGPSVRRSLATAARWRECPTCVKRIFPALAGEGAEFAKTLCGRDSVQLVPERPRTFDFDALAPRLLAAARVTRGAESLTAVFPDATITLFADGRAIVKGTLDPERGRSLFARYIGA